MLRKCVSGVTLLLITFGLGFWAGRGTTVNAQSKNRVFELRIANLENKEKLNVLMNRFRGGEVKIWERLGMKGVGFWVPIEGTKTQLIYILAHKSKEAAGESFGAFRTDPDWVKAKEDSEKKAGGSLTEGGMAGVQSVFMNPTDYSQTK